MTISFVAPTSMAELINILSGPGQQTLIAGGTDLLVAPTTLSQTGVIVDLGRLPDLQRIEIQDNVLIIGAGVTVARLAHDPLIRQFAPALADAADDFGSVQIRNRATIGGNMANGAAAADLAPPLAVMSALAATVSPDGAGLLPVMDLLAARPAIPARTALVAFHLPMQSKGSIGAFVKLGRRQEPTISRLTLAAAEQQGTIRIVAGAIGPTPRRLKLAETALNNGGTGFPDALADEVTAAIAGRASLVYKAQAIRALGGDLLHRLSKVAQVQL